MSVKQEDVAHMAEMVKLLKSRLEQVILTMAPRFGG